MHLFYLPYFALCYSVVVCVIACFSLVILGIFRFLCVVQGCHLFIVLAFFVVMKYLFHILYLFVNGMCSFMMLSCILFGVCLLFFVH